ncbi:MAG: hypothetical protein IT237_13870 [Bacteroidia bacterium]|nr:hypothetical protein [Bacteroidia bacterium]
MKKLTIILSVVAVAALTSCKKDRVCECTYTSNAPSGPVTTTNVDKITYSKVSKGTAKKACVTTETTYTGATYVSTADCKLK